jgi:hypothetical protein
MNSDFSKAIDKFFSLGRHYLISIIVLTQYLKKVLTPLMRANCDNLFFSINNVPSLEVIYEMIVYPKDKKHFINFVKNNTNNYQFIMYDNLSRDINENIYIVKAEKTENFTIKNKNMI